MKHIHARSAFPSLVSYSRLVFEDVPKAAEAPAGPTAAEKAAEEKSKAEAASKEKVRSELEGVRSGIIVEPTFDPVKDNKTTLLEKAAEKMKSVTFTFTRDTRQAFFQGIYNKAKEVLKDEADKDKMVYLYYDSVSTKFRDSFIEKYYFLLADGVEGDIALDFIVDGTGKVTSFKEKDSEKVKKAKESVDNKTKEAAGSPEVAAEMDRFQRDHGEAFVFLQQVMGKSDAEMKEAFAGKGLLGFFLGVIGYGKGQKTYSSIINNKDFAKFADSVKEAMAKLSPALDFQRPVELEKESDLNKFYDKLPANDYRTVEKRFEVKKEITIPAVTTFGSIVFPKKGTEEKIEIAQGSKDDSRPFEPLSLKRDERHEKITVAANTKLEAGTVFSGITIGDKAAIEAALKTESAGPVAAATPAAKPADAAAAAGGEAVAKKEEEKK